MVLKQLLQYSPKQLTLPTVQTESQRIGSAFHSYILEKESFFETYYVFPDVDAEGNKWDFRKKEHKAFRAGILESHSEDRIINSDTFNHFLNVERELRSNGVFDNHLCKGDSELSLFVKMKNDTFKCRFDYFKIVDGDAFIYDIKTTSSAHPVFFGNTAAKLSYDMAASLYVSAVREVLPELRSITFIWIACELKPPYHTALYRLNKRTYNAGLLKLDEALSIYNSTVKHGIYPGYPAEKEVMDLILPNWSFLIEDLN
jgi:hypothetical protein